jgi:hypothetical protein
LRTDVIGCFQNPFGYLVDLNHERHLWENVDSRFESRGQRPLLLVIERSPAVIILRLLNGTSW